MTLTSDQHSSDPRKGTMTTDTPTPYTPPDGVIWPRIRTHRHCERCGRLVPWHHTRPGYGCLRCREQEDRK